MDRVEIVSIHQKFGKQCYESKANCSFISFKHQQWEKSNQHLANFIQTKTKPHIFYMPKKQTPETEKRLKETKDKYLSKFKNE